MISDEAKIKVEDIQGKEISSIALKDDILMIDFEDGTQVDIFDDGQSCCEDRYMSTDEDYFDSYKGAIFNGVDISTIEHMEEDECGNYHDVVFVRIETDKGFFTIYNHNSHNGYYGGFDMVITKRGARDE